MDINEELSCVLDALYDEGWYMPVEVSLKLHAQRENYPWCPDVDSQRAELLLEQLALRGLVEEDREYPPDHPRRFRRLVAPKYEVVH